MSPEQIATGWDYSQEDILDYLESICKPVPNWEDDVSERSPVPCWVGDDLEQLKSHLYIGLICFVNQTWSSPYFCVPLVGASSIERYRWKHARPISPDECWQPTKQGELR